MCKAGGLRCDNADAITLARRKIKRSKEYRQAGEYKKEQVLQEQLDKWKNENSEFVQNHARKRMSFNTRAAPKSAKQLKAFKNAAKSTELFSKPTEDSYDVNDLIAENQQLKEALSDSEDGEDAYNSLQRYSFITFTNINSYLRNDRGHKDYPDEDLVGQTHEDIENMDTAFATKAKAKMKKIQAETEAENEAEEQHVVYRETYVPAGWTPAEYAEKYYRTGEVIADPAYMSTSHSQSYIVEKTKTEKKRRRGQDSLVLKVLTAEGVSMQSDQPGNSRIQSREMERLLPRDHRMVVVGQSRQTFVDAELTQRHSSYAHHRGPKQKTLTVVHLVDEALFSRLQKEDAVKE